MPNNSGEGPFGERCEDIVVYAEGPILVIRINRPEVRNACRIQTLEEMSQMLVAAGADDQIRCIILCGTGAESFCSGADLKEFQALAATMSVDQRMRGWRQFLAVIDRIRKPVIAAVRGYAVGGGTEIVLAAHIVLASDTARFGLPEVLRGHIPGAAGTVSLPRQVGAKLGLYYLLTGEDITADVALRAGLVAKVVADDRLEDEAMKLATHLSAQSPGVLAALIESVIVGRDLSNERAIELERELCRVVRGSADYEEGLNAFLEKRQPNYGGIGKEVGGVRE